MRIGRVDDTRRGRLSNNPAPDSASRRPGRSGIEGVDETGVAKPVESVDVSVARGVSVYWDVSVTRLAAGDADRPGRRGTTNALDDQEASVDLPSREALLNNTRGARSTSVMHWSVRRALVALRTVAKIHKGGSRASCPMSSVRGSRRPQGQANARKV